MFGPFSKFYMAIAINRLVKYQSNILIQAIMSELVRRYVIPAIVTAFTNKDNPFIAGVSQNIVSGGGGSQLLDDAKQLLTKQLLPLLHHNSTSSSDYSHHGSHQYANKSNIPVPQLSSILNADCSLVRGTEQQTLASLQPLLTENVWHHLLASQGNLMASAIQNTPFKIDSKGVLTYSSPFSQTSYTIPNPFGIGSNALLRMVGAQPVQQTNAPILDHQTVAHVDQHLAPLQHSSPPFPVTSASNQLQHNRWTGANVPAVAPAPQWPPPLVMQHPAQQLLVPMAPFGRPNLGAGGIGFGQVRAPMRFRTTNSSTPEQRLIEILGRLEAKLPGNETADSKGKSGEQKDFHSVKSGQKSSTSEDSSKTNQDTEAELDLDEETLNKLLAKLIAEANLTGKSSETTQSERKAEPVKEQQSPMSTTSQHMNKTTPEIPSLQSVEELADRVLNKTFMHWMAMNGQLSQLSPPPSSNRTAKPALPNQRLETGPRSGLLAQEVSDVIASSFAQIMRGSSMMSGLEQAMPMNVEDGSLDMRLAKAFSSPSPTAQPKPKHRSTTTTTATTTHMSTPVGPIHISLSADNVSSIVGQLLALAGSTQAPARASASTTTTTTTGKPVAKKHTDLRRDGSANKASAQVQTSRKLVGSGNSNDTDLGRVRPAPMTSVTKAITSTTTTTTTSSTTSSTVAPASRRAQVGSTGATDVDDGDIGKRLNSSSIERADKVNSSPTTVSMLRLEQRIDSRDALQEFSPSRRQPMQFEASEPSNLLRKSVAQQIPTDELRSTQYSYHRQVDAQKRRGDRRQKQPLPVAAGAIKQVASAASTPAHRSGGGGGDLNNLAMALNVMNMVLLNQRLANATQQQTTTATGKQVVPTGSSAATQQNQPKPSGSVASSATATATNKKLRPASVSQGQRHLSEAQNEPQVSSSSSLAKKSPTNNTARKRKLPPRSRLYKSHGANGSGQKRQRSNAAVGGGGQNTTPTKQVRARLQHQSADASEHANHRTSSNAIKLHSTRILAPEVAGASGEYGSTEASDKVPERGSGQTEAAAAASNGISNTANYLFQPLAMGPQRQPAQLSNDAAAAAANSESKSSMAPEVVPAGDREYATRWNDVLQHIALT